MPLYDRLMGLDRPALAKIPVHAFSALMAEFARGQITGAQAQAGVTTISGTPLSPSEVVEAQDLLATINGSGVAKLARAKEIDDVLMLAEAGAVYVDSSGVKARLGV